MSSLPWDRQRTLVLLALANGLSRAAASARAGISDRTLRRWVADDEPFAEAVEIAMGSGRAMYEELLRSAGKKDWRAALAAYEVIYLGGVRAGKATAAVVVQQVQQTFPAQSEEVTAAQAQEVLALLAEAYGGDMERVARAIARNDQMKRLPVPRDSSD